MAMADSDAITKRDLDLAVEQLEAKIDGINERLEGKIDGIKSWITGVAFVAGVGIILSVAAINVSLITALR